MKKISRGLVKDLEYMDQIRKENLINKYISVMALVECGCQDDEDGEIFWIEECPICLSGEGGGYGAFSIDTELNTFRCTQCQASGGSFTLLRLLLKLNPKETIEYVQKMFL